MSMLNIPELKQSILMVVLEQENLDRMAKADPVTLESPRAGGILPVPLFPLNFSVLIATETDQAKLHEMAKRSNGAEFLQWLERGRRFIEGKDGAEHARKV